MQPDPADISSRPQSPDGLWSWDGTQWIPNRIGPRPPPFATPRLRSDLAVAFLLILVALNVFDVINSGLDLVLYRGLTASRIGGSEALWSEWRNTLTAVLWLTVAFPGSVVFVSMWVHRAYRNLNSLGHQSTMSPGMAVAWFYIPIANLWKPLGVVREIWNATPKGAAAGVLGVWWACWLAGCVAGNIQFWASTHEPSVPTSRTVPLLLSFPSDLLFIAAALLLVRIILSATVEQERQASRMSGDQNSVAPTGSASRQG
jgi:hypothetical protein